MIRLDEVFLRPEVFSVVCVFLCDSAVTRMIEEGAVKTVRGREKQKRERGLLCEASPLRGHSHIMSALRGSWGHPKSR